MSGFHRVCSVFDLDEGKVLTAEVEGEPVAIVVSQDLVFAIRDVCSHASQCAARMRASRHAAEPAFGTP